MAPFSVVCACSYVQILPVPSSGARNTALRNLCKFLKRSNFYCSLPENEEAILQKGTHDDDVSQVPDASKAGKNVDYDSEIKKDYSEDMDFNKNRWKLELVWLTKALEPALQLWKWALPTGKESMNKSPPRTRSVSEILASIQRSRLGIKEWSLSDLTVGLYLIYLHQACTNPFEDVKGVQISSESIVQDLIYFSELARGAYKSNVVGLARHSMLRESNILKYVKDSNVLRPGYYVGIDECRKLVILGIRGTHTIYDLITDVVTSSNEELTFEGYSTHFGTAEAARWFLAHEIGTIRKCLDKHRGFRLRLVGHSLGGATASLLAIMLRRKTYEELGFNPDIVSAVGYATPPCVSKELAENCSSYVTTVVMQDDIVPRLSVASLTRLRNEILQTDWVTVLEKEDWKNVVGLVTNARQIMSSIQDVARKLTDYASFWSKTDPQGMEVDPFTSPSLEAPSNSPVSENYHDGCVVPEELFVPGALFYLRRDGGDKRKKEVFTLWKRHPGEHFQRIVLSDNLLSDHKCDNHYYALRDVLKGLPTSIDEFIFR